MDSLLGVVVAFAVGGAFLARARKPSRRDLDHFAAPEGDVTLGEGSFTPHLPDTTVASAESTTQVGA